MGKVLAKPEDLQGKEEEDDPIASKSMFSFKQAVGKSSFGMVWKVIKKSNKQEFAIKIMDKAAVYNFRSVDCVLNEMTLLSYLRNPFICNMHYAF